ncbi:hypothetical protein [Albirhodobacter sp. R86504]|uniref:hypothetical protein n=1 Tax=Albirhodobacter sp. R86504 TaxID=3093848 RepID=UPI00366CEA79
MSNKKSIVDQIQGILGEMEDTGFFDELAKLPEKVKAPEKEERKTPRDPDVDHPHDKS